MSSLAKGHELPVGSFFPASTLQPALPDAVSETHNQTLLAGSEQLAAAGVNVRMVDFAAIAGEITADPSAFAFLAPLSTFRFFGIGGNPTVTETPDGPVLSFPENPASLPNLDQQLFFDLVHPTAAGQGVFAAFYSENLTSDVQILGGGILHQFCTNLDRIWRYIIESGANIPSQNGLNEPLNASYTKDFGEWTYADSNGGPHRCQRCALTN